MKRNKKRFPPAFMFQPGASEWISMRSQIVTAPGIEEAVGSRSISILQDKRNINTTPYAFTEQGVAMLSGILRSDKAINMNISIMRAFVEVRKLVFKQMDMKEQLKEIKERLGDHDAQLNGIYDAMENLLDEKAAQSKWEDRDRIGFQGCAGQTSPPASLQ